MCVVWIFFLLFHFKGRDHTDTFMCNCQMSPTSANCCQLIARDRATVFPVLGQLAAAELTHHSLKPLRLPYCSRLRFSLRLAGDVHPNPAPATLYRCAVCTSNVTSRGVSFKCNQCSGWVHLKCSGLKNAAQYRKTKDSVCSSYNSPAAPSQPQASPPATPTTTINDAHLTILQWNANRIGNKIDEIGIFMEKHKVKVAVIQESKLPQTSSGPCIQNYTTVRKDRRPG